MRIFTDLSFKKLTVTFIPPHVGGASDFVFRNLGTRYFDQKPCSGDWAYKWQCVILTVIKKSDVMHMCPGKTKLTEQKTIRWCLLWLDWTRLDDVYFDSDEISWGRLRPIEWEKMHLLGHIYIAVSVVHIWLNQLDVTLTQFFFTQLAGCLLRFWWDSPVAGHHQARSHHW